MVAGASGADMVVGPGLVCRRADRPSAHRSRRRCGRLRQCSRPAGAILLCWAAFSDESWESFMLLWRERKKGREGG